MGSPPGGLGPSSKATIRVQQVRARGRHRMPMAGNRADRPAGLPGRARLLSYGNRAAHALFRRANRGVRGNVGCVQEDDDDRFSWRSEEHTSELQSQSNLVCRLLLEKKKKK